MTDLSPKEQEHTRRALRYLRARCGGWDAASKALGLAKITVMNVAGGHGTASPRVVFRIARFAGVGIDAVLAGEYPPAGACAHCGHVASAD